MAGGCCLPTCRAHPSTRTTTATALRHFHILAFLFLLASGVFTLQVSGLQCDILRPLSNEHFALFTSNSFGYITDSQFDPSRLWFVQPDPGYLGDELSHFSVIENSLVVQESLGSLTFPALRLYDATSVASFRAQHLAGNWSRPFSILMRFRLTDDSIDRNTAIISQQQYSPSRAHFPESGFSLVASGDMKATVLFSGALSVGTLIVARSTDPVFIPGQWHVVAVSVDTNRSPFARLVVDGAEVPLAIRTSLEHLGELVPDTSVPEQVVIGRWAPELDCSPQISDIGDLIVCDAFLADDRMACMHEFYFGQDGVDLLSVPGVEESSVTIECTESIPSKSSSSTPTPSITPTFTPTSTLTPSTTPTSSISPTSSSSVSPSTSVTASPTSSTSSSTSSSPSVSRTTSSTFTPSSSISMSVSLSVTSSASTSGTSSRTPSVTASRTPLSLSATPSITISGTPCALGPSRTLATPNSAVSVAGGYGMAPWGGSSGWPDGAAMWIWNTASSQSSAATGVNVRLQYLFTSDFCGTIVVHAIVDNNSAFYLNGNLVGTFAGGWGTPYAQFSVSINRGTNLFQFVNSNGGGPAGLLVAVIRSSTGASIFRTDSTWTVF